MPNSKQKGARFERQLAMFFRDYGYDAHRSAQYCGNTGQAADVVGVPYIHIEAKHQETMRLYDWMEQSVRDSKNTDDIPCVIHKKNNAPILVTFRLSDFMPILNEYISSKKLEEEMNG